MPDGALVAGRLRERGRVAEPRKREGHVLAAEGVGVVFAHGGLCRSVCVVWRLFVCLVLPRIPV